ncbi:hypothetical protein C0992_007762 [Termitomyces sp. T32_za158]|nr:hypothetical protein C0992_007762 [Termitomyces sp. T32_za158]
MEAPFSSSSSTAPSDEKEVLLVVFVHGFKGDDRTFSDFPDRLQHVLAESTRSSVDVECIVFPVYETKGELYLGIHPNVFKNGVTKAKEYATAAQTIGSAVFGAFAGLGANRATASTSQSAPASGWSLWAAPAACAAGGALLAGAAAGSAYYKSEHLSSGLTWAKDHMKYVGNLWDEAALFKRIDALMTVKKQAGVAFHAFYTMVPATPPFSAARTFIILPKRASPQYAYFSAAKNTKALDEVQAHIGMFNAKTNDGYYELGLATAKIIRESLQSRRNASSQRSEEATL